MSMAFQAVRKVALSLDGVEEGTSYGTAAFRVKGELFARQHQDMESLVLRTDFEQRAELMAADPETYYITDHYLKYEWVLVRMARLHPDALRDLLRMACRFATEQARHGRTQAQRTIAICCNCVRKFARTISRSAIPFAFH